MYYNAKTNLCQLVGFFDDVKLVSGPLSFEFLGLDIFVVRFGVKKYFFEGTYEVSAFWVY